MYRKQTNKTALLSQHLIADALLRLMRKESFQSITVTDICNEGDTVTVKVIDIDNSGKIRLSRKAALKEL